MSANETHKDRVISGYYSPVSKIAEFFSSRDIQDIFSGFIDNEKTMKKYVLIILYFIFVVKIYGLYTKCFKQFQLK